MAGPLSCHTRVLGLCHSYYMKLLKSSKQQFALKKFRESDATLDLVYHIAKVKGVSTQAHSGSRIGHAHNRDSTIIHTLC